MRQVVKMWVDKWPKGTGKVLKHKGGLAVDERKTLSFTYTYRFVGRDEKKFHVQLDYETLGLVVEPKAELPEWTRLDFHQCGNCPLKPAEHPRCPVAVNLVDLIEFFRNHQSFHELELEVESRNRRYTAATSTQRGVGALIGLVMVASGCPIMDRMRPMVDTHLPVMTLEESTYRLISMFFTAQYFRTQRGLEPDWNLQHLVDLLKQTHQVNVGFADRLRSIRVQDASLNAIVNLNTSSDFVSIAMQSNWLSRFERIFLDHARWAEPLEPPAAAEKSK